MKRILLLAALICCALPLSAQWFRQPTPNDTLQSVRVLPDGRVLFQLYAPEAGTVAVTGDLPWDKPVKFEKNADGVWQGLCDGLADGCFRYSFLVDGVRVQDPKAPLSAEQASVFTKGESYVKDVPHGALAQRWYWSSTLGCLRRMHVWTPAGYEKSAEALPVLYLIHGGGDNDASWPGVGAAGWILDNLLAEGKMVPMIVVMPNGTIETDDMMGEVPLFGEDMVASIIPFVEANYRVVDDQAHRDRMSNVTFSMDLRIHDPKTFDHIDLPPFEQTVYFHLPWTAISSMQKNQFRISKTIFTYRASVFRTGMFRAAAR